MSSLPVPVGEQPGLLLPDSLTFADWMAIGDRLGRVTQNVQWAIGDWWAFGERAYGATARTALPTGFALQTVKNAGWVAAKVASSRRRDNLTFSHHAEIAALDPDQQDELLTEAEMHGWGVRALREAVVGLRALSDVSAEEETDEATESTADGLPPEPADDPPAPPPPPAVEKKRKPGSKKDRPDAPADPADPFLDGLWSALASAGIEDDALLGRAAEFVRAEVEPMLADRDETIGRLTKRIAAADSPRPHPIEALLAMSPRAAASAAPYREGQLRLANLERWVKDFKSGLASAPPGHDPAATVATLPVQPKKAKAARSGSSGSCHHPVNRRIGTWCAECKQELGR